MPQSRWLYSTDPMLFVVTPPFLAFLSGNLLRPTTVRDVVHFANDDCDLTPSYLLSDRARNATLGAMYDQLTRALGTGGGHLVLLDDDVHYDDAPAEWKKAWVRRAVVHVTSGEHRKQMFLKFKKYTGEGDDPSALAANRKGKTFTQTGLQKAEHKRKDDLKAPAGPEMEPREPARIDILGRDEPAAPSAAGTGGRITPQRTD